MKRQIRLTLYAEYTKRYQEIIFRFPVDIFKNDFSYDNYLVEKEAILRNMRVYFDLCSEEYFLRNKLDNKVWKEWENGMIATFKCPAFKTAWEIFNSDKIDYFDTFKTYINTKMYFK